jgi:hypothetical protein
MKPVPALLATSVCDIYIQMVCCVGCYVLYCVYDMKLMSAFPCTRTLIINGSNTLSHPSLVTHTSHHKYNAQHHPHPT